MSIIDAILGYPVIAALCAFIPSAIYFHVLRKRKINAAINLIYLYAKDAEKLLDKSSNNFNKTYQDITDGSPFGEPDKNYMPLLFYAEKTSLSFEQISEIFQYLNENEHEILLAYFISQSNVDALIYQINTDYVRSLPQTRKKKIWGEFTAQSGELHKKTKDLVEMLDKRKAKKESIEQY